MSIITIASSKGGAGKTTVARLLLGHASRHGCPPRRSMPISITR